MSPVFWDLDLAKTSLATFVRFLGKLLPVNQIVLQHELTDLVCDLWQSQNPLIAYLGTARLPNWLSELLSTLPLKALIPLPFLKMSERAVIMFRDIKYATILDRLLVDAKIK
jgi:hypothetical protein